MRILTFSVIYRLFICFVSEHRYVHSMCGSQWEHDIDLINWPINIWPTKQIPCITIHPLWWYYRTRTGTQIYPYLHNIYIDAHHNWCEPSQLHTVQITASGILGHVCVVVQSVHIITVYKCTIVQISPDVIIMLST